MTYCCALRLWSQICITCQSCWFPELGALSCCAAGQDASGPRDGGIRTKWIWSISPTQVRVWLLRIADFRVCGAGQNLYVLSLYRNPDLDDRIFNGSLTSMTAVKAEDVRASFLFVGDLNDHHKKGLGSTTINRHSVTAFDFATVSGCDQFVVGPTHARGKHLTS